MTFEREYDLSPPTDDEIIIATVRITNSFRRASVEGGDELPSRYDSDTNPTSASIYMLTSLTYRPQRRSFFRRVSTRIGSPTDPSRYTAMKMPRGDYKKYFARDKEGNYAGTEPEKEWSKEDLDAAFGQYQDMRLRSIPGGNEFGDGLDIPAGRSGSGSFGSPGRGPSGGPSGGPNGVGGFTRSISAAEMSGRHGNVYLI